MLKVYFVVALLSVIVCIGVLNAQTERWVYNYDGPANGVDMAFWVIMGSDGNLYTVGTSESLDVYQDFMVISLTSGGGERWRYRSRGPIGLDDWAFSVTMGTDGNIYATGYQDNGQNPGPGTDDEFTVVSLTAGGGERWIYRYNGPGDDSDIGYSIIMGSDGNVYAAGYSDRTPEEPDMCVISLTSGGGERWVYRYNGAGNLEDEAYSIIMGSDGNLYVAGYSTIWTTTDEQEFTVISLIPGGAERWVYRYNGPGTFNVANSIIMGTDGNLYAAGVREDATPGDYEFVVISLDTAGNEEWVYVYDDPVMDNAQAAAITMGQDGNLYAAGTSAGTGTGLDFTVISLSQAGGERWVYTYNGAGNGEDIAWTVLMGSDGNIYAAGYSTENDTTLDFTVVSLTAVGTERWVYTYAGGTKGYNVAFSMVMGTDGNLYVAGCSDTGMVSDYTVISINPVTGIAEDIYLSSRTLDFWMSLIRGGFEVCAPGFPDGTRCEVFDVVGRKIGSAPVRGGKVEFTDICSGIYFVSILSDRVRTTKKTLVLR